jgi:hypothetical protein
MYVYNRSFQLGYGWMDTRVLSVPTILIIHFFYQDLVSHTHSHRSHLIFQNTYLTIKFLLGLEFGCVGLRILRYEQQE